MRLYRGEPKGGETEIKKPTWKQPSLSLNEGKKVIESKAQHGFQHTIFHQTNQKQDKRKKNRNKTKTHTAKKQIVESNAACLLTCHFPLDTKETGKKKKNENRKNRSKKKNSREQQNIPDKKRRSNFKVQRNSKRLFPVTRKFLLLQRINTICTYLKLRFSGYVLIDLVKLEIPLLLLYSHPRLSSETDDPNIFTLFLPLTAHTPYICGFAWSDMVHDCTVYTALVPRWQQFHIAPAMPVL